jgi:hypothetical protein
LRVVSRGRSPRLLWPLCLGSSALFGFEVAKRAEDVADLAERAESYELAFDAGAEQCFLAWEVVVDAAGAGGESGGAMVWQRRPRLAKLKLEGVPHVQMWHTILAESLILLVTGCLSGAAFGVYGQQLADRALAETINFPVVYSLTPLIALWSVISVIAATLAILAIPGYLAASVPAVLALQD